MDVHLAGGEAGGDAGRAGGLRPCNGSCTEGGICGIAHYTVLNASV